MGHRSDHRPFTVWLLIILQLLLSLGALVSGALMIAVPDGSLMNMPASMLQYSPFSNFLIPGIILFLFNGCFPLAVAYSLWQKPTWRWPDTINPFKQRHWSWASSLAAGVILLIWIVVEMLMLQSIAFLQVVYLIWGGLLILLTLARSVRLYCTPKKK